MKLLHTADWHIGRLLHGRKRYEEFARFADWLIDLIAQENVEALLVAGDIFDTTSPSNYAQELYFNFLSKALQLPSCRHILIIGGNHDSPTLLNAPKKLLRSFDIHVVGAALNPSTDEIVILKDKNGAPEMIVCLVPYLRDQDIRTVEAGESADDKARKTLEGISRHYHEVGLHADAIRKQIGRPIPLVAMGHLFAAGGKTVREDGVRDLYVGTIGQVGADAFPGCLDYLALGHLHVPQKVAGNDWMRYSGSPLKLGFGEAGQQKEVVIVNFQQSAPTIQSLPIPDFQRMETIEGNWQHIETRLEALKTENESVWLEIYYESDEIIGNLMARLAECIKGSKLEVLKAFNRSLKGALTTAAAPDRLEELDEEEVFCRHLDQEKVAEGQREGLIATYREALFALRQQDKRAF